MAKKHKPSDHITDNPTVQQAIELLPMLNFVKRGTQILNLFGVRTTRLQRIKTQIEKVEKEVEFITIPDRFNKNFGADGWIATSSLAAKTMQNAVEFAEQGDREAAEIEIMSWFTEENIRLFAIKRAQGFHKANGRWDQLQEALKLFLEERYISAVPLILIACDGFASDVLGTSPFEKNADLSCFDSIVGHPNSLPALIRLVTKGVRKSSDEPLAIPLRHGILHGQSLGYANKTVCAKAWLLMIALVDWAQDKKTEEKRLAEYERLKNISFRNVLEQSRRNQKIKKEGDSWRVRTSERPANTDIDENSPEYAFFGFFDGWKEKNYGKMATHSVNRKGISAKKMAGDLRGSIDFLTLKSYEIIEVRHVTPVRANAVVKVQTEVWGKLIDGEYEFFAIRYSPDGSLPDSINAVGKWQVQQNSIYQTMHEKSKNRKDE